MTVAVAPYHIDVAFLPSPAFVMFAEGSPMTPQEFEIAIRTALSYPLLVPWLGYLTIVVVAFVGGFFGAYLKKKGESLATREEFNTLLEQTRQTTRDTETIKLNLASHNWLNQQQWQLREKHYTAILEGLFKLKISLEERASYYRDPESETREDHIRTKHFEEQTYLGAEAFEKVQRLTGPAAIVMSGSAVSALESLGQQHREISEHSVNLAEYIRAFHAAVSATYARVLEEAKRELLGQSHS